MRQTIGRKVQESGGGTKCIIEFHGVGILSLRPSAQKVIGKGRRYQHVRNFIGPMDISQVKPFSTWLP